MRLEQHGKISQRMLILILILLTLLVSLMIWKSSDPNAIQNPQQEELESSDSHENEGEIALSSEQILEQGLQFAQAKKGEIQNIMTLAGKLVVNTDQQAHISPNFSGHVEQVNVELGQNVQKGQTLALLSVPELIDQQSNLKIAQANLDLARQDFEREKQLWNQGVSAQQDYQRAENAYRQAQITVQSAASRLKALGASGLSQGKFAIKAPISGVISQKDIVVGENVQLTDQLFVIEQLQDLWLEFTVPNSLMNEVYVDEIITFKVNGSSDTHQAKIQHISSQADAQTGRLVVRAKVNSNATALRPNVLTTVSIATIQPKTVLRIAKSAIQPIDGKKQIFIVESEQQGKVHLKVQDIELGAVSSDGQWVEVISGIKETQKYVTQGSFLLKSELEKNEAGHEH